MAIERYSGIDPNTTINNHKEETPMSIEKTLEDNTEAVTQLLTAIQALTKAIGSISIPTAKPEPTPGNVYPNASINQPATDVPIVEDTASGSQAADPDKTAAPSNYPPGLDHESRDGDTPPLPWDKAIHCGSGKTVGKNNVWKKRRGMVPGEYEAKIKELKEFYSTTPTPLVEAITPPVAPAPVAPVAPVAPTPPQPVVPAPFPEPLADVTFQDVVTVQEYMFVTHGEEAAQTLLDEWQTTDLNNLTPDQWVTYIGWARDRHEELSDK